MQVIVDIFALIYTKCHENKRLSLKESRTAYSTVVPLRNAWHCAFRRTPSSNSRYTYNCISWKWKQLVAALAKAVMGEHT